MTASDSTLAAAIAIANETGWRSITRDAVAERAGVATGTVNYIWGTVERLRAAVMRHAVAAGDLTILAQGLADGHADAQEAPIELRRAALERML